VLLFVNPCLPSVVGGTGIGDMGPATRVLLFVNPPVVGGTGIGDMGPATATVVATASRAVANKREGEIGAMRIIGSSWVRLNL